MKRNYGGSPVYLHSHERVKRSLTGRWHSTALWYTQLGIDETIVWTLMVWKKHTL